MTAATVINAMIFHFYLPSFWMNAFLYVVRIFIFLILPSTFWFFIPSLYE